MCFRRRRIAGIIEDWAQESDGVEETRSIYDHDEIDGVEIVAAAEASGEIGICIHGGIELVADGTEETELVLGEFGGQFEQVGDEWGDGYVIAQAEKEMFVQCFRR